MPPRTWPCRARNPSRAGLFLDTSRPSAAPLERRAAPRNPSRIELRANPAAQSREPRAPGPWRPGGQRRRRLPSTKTRRTQRPSWPGRTVRRGAAPGGCAAPPRGFAGLQRAVVGLKRTERRGSNLRGGGAGNGATQASQVHARGGVSARDPSPRGAPSSERDGALEG